MKNKKMKEMFSGWISVALVCMSLLSCNSEEPTDPNGDDGSNGNPTEENKVQMNFTSIISDFSRSTFNNNWTGDEIVAVSIDNGISSKKYRVNKEDGTMLPNSEVDEYFWKDDKNSVNVLAWTPRDFSVNSDGKGGAVNIVDQTNNIEKLDLLYAYTENASYNETTPIRLDFKHRMVKIVAGIEGENADRAELKLFGYVSGAFSASKNEFRGLEEPLKEITPKKTENSTHVALLIPTDMSGKNLFRVLVDGNEYPCNYEQELGILKEGYVYEYTLSIDKTKVSVSLNSVAEWEEGEEIEGNIK